MEKKRVAILLGAEEFAKLKQIAEQEKRFISRQASYWIKRGIREYEREYGSLTEEKKT